MLKGLTRSQLATVVNVYPSTIGRIERGEFQHPGTIKKMADVLGVAMEELIVEEVAR